MTAMLPPARPRNRRAAPEAVAALRAAETNGLSQAPAFGERDTGDDRRRDLDRWAAAVTPAPLCDLSAGNTRRTAPAV